MEAGSVTLFNVPLAFPLQLSVPVPLPPMTSEPVFVPQLTGAFTLLTEIVGDGFTVIVWLAEEDWQPFAVAVSV